MNVKQATNKHSAIHDLKFTNLSSSCTSYESSSIFVTILLYNSSHKTLNLITVEPIKDTFGINFFLFVFFAFFVRKLFLLWRLLCT